MQEMNTYHTCLMYVKQAPCLAKRLFRNCDVSMPTLLEEADFGEPGTARRAPPSAAWYGCVRSILVNGRSVVVEDGTKRGLQEGNEGGCERVREVRVSKVEEGGWPGKGSDQGSTCKREQVARRTVRREKTGGVRQVAGGGSCMETVNSTASSVSRYTHFHPSNL